MDDGGVRLTRLIPFATPVLAVAVFLAGQLFGGALALSAVSVLGVFGIIAAAFEVRVKIGFGLVIALLLNVAVTAVPFILFGMARAL